MTSKDIAEDPHYRARGMHVEWEDEQVGKVKGIGVAPKFSLTPGKIVRGSVRSDTTTIASIARCSASAPTSSSRCAATK